MPVTMWRIVRDKGCGTCGTSVQYDNCNSIMLKVPIRNHPNGIFDLPGEDDPVPPNTFDRMSISKEAWPKGAQLKAKKWNAIKKACLTDTPPTARDL